MANKVSTLPTGNRFKKVEAFLFHHGGHILGFQEFPGSGLNAKIKAEGWSLVDADMLEEIIKKHQGFLYRLNACLLATHPKTIKSDEDDLIVPLVDGATEGPLYVTQKRFHRGIVPDHSNIKILVVKLERNLRSV